MRFLLFGGTGQIGKEFLALAFPKNVQVVAPSRSILDLTKAEPTIRMIGDAPWSAVINAAAYTDVDLAEREEHTAFAVNAEAPSCLAEETGRRGIPLIHISTDYVFDGRKGTPYVEQDRVEPLNAYGRSKLAGELGVSAGNARHIILRTSWVYSPYRKNFLKTIVRLVAEQDRLFVVADQRGCPTAAHDIAKTCLNIAIRCASQPNHAPYGVFHYAGAGDASWFEFARAILDMMQTRTGKSIEVTPISAPQYSTPAPRPADTRLNCAAVISAYGVTLRPWQDGISDTLHRLAARKSTG
jgi:dTDP-4-dehydrorhamnose reductase